MELLNLKSKEIIPYDEYLGIDHLEFKISKEAMIEIAFWGQNQNSYKQAQKMLEKYRNILIGSDTVLKVTEYVGKIVYEKDDTQARKNYENIANIATVEKEKVNDTLYGLIDGSAVNTRVEDENGSTWKENKLGMFFSDKSLYKRKDKSNMITKKEFTTIFGNVEKFKEHFFNLALKQDYLSYKKVIFITDGATWIRNMLNELFPDAIQILDKFHLLENIGDYAKAIFKDNERKVKNFVDRTFERILNKEFNLIYSELRKYKNLSLPTGTVNLETYIKNNENKIDYRYYEAQGWFVGSGAIESSNKTVIQRRTKQPGMRWSVNGGQYMLTLRAKEESGLWIDEVKKRVLAFC